MASSELTRTSVTTGDIVAKLWNLCHVLRDDGITYNEYVTELTYLLFLKMLAETGHEDKLPKEYRWSEVARRTGMDQLTYYRQLMLDLGDATKTKDKTVLAIFSDAQTKLRKPTNYLVYVWAIQSVHSMSPLALRKSFLSGASGAPPAASHFFQAWYSALDGVSFLSRLRLPIVLVTTIIGG